MAIPAALVVLPVGILFILSGLLVNLTQAILFVIVRPLAKNWYRRINKLLVESLWLEVVWLFDWWAGIKRSGCLGSSVAVMKKELKYLPVIGWSMWFSDYVFLERSWNKDETTLNSSFQQLEDFPMPLWLAVFVEGTRFTELKLLSAQQFAASKGLPIPRNVLIPRTKGFVSAVTRTRAFIGAIYDCTFAVPKSQPSPTLMRMFRGISSSVKVEIRRHSMEELPQTPDGIAQWCRDIFVAKDAVLERYRITDMFSEQEKHDIGRPKISLVVVIGWCCVLVLLIVMDLQWSQLLCSRRGLLFSALLLSLVAIIMQLLILSSAADASPSSINSPPKDSLKETLLPT